MDNSNYKARNLKVFLCHAKEDEEQVELLDKQLKMFGIESWLDKDKLQPGFIWDEVIEKELDSADIVIICLSDVSVEKTGYVNHEIRLSLKKADYYNEDEIYLIPVRLNECEVPFKLKKFQYIDAFNPNGFDRLIKALKVKAEKLNIESIKYDGYKSLSTVTITKMIYNSGNDTSANLFRMICENVREGKVQKEILVEFKNHPYWLIRKLAIEEIIELDGEETLNLLSEYKDVSYHISQSLIRNYIESHYDSRKLNAGEIKEAIIILNHLAQAKKVSATSRSKDIRLLRKIEEDNKQA